jgi:hypothetical protein
VPKQDIWPLGNCSTCTIGSNWNGTTVTLAGFKNEMIGGGLMLQAGPSDATNVHVAISALTGPGGAVISSTPTLCAATTGYLTRDFEIFVATYVQIVGMTKLSWFEPAVDEHDRPLRFRVPSSSNAITGQWTPTGSTAWTSRPDANKFMPDALIPEECVSSFTVAASSSQLVWVDFYLASTLSAGAYIGTITVTEGVTVSTSIPIQVTVYNGSLPDTPALKYMTNPTLSNINYRINGYAHGPPSCTTAACVGTDNAFYQSLWRHRLIPIGDSPDVLTNFYPSTQYQAQIDGTLFSASKGYRGPGLNTSVGIYSIGTYGGWFNGAPAGYGNSNWSRTNADSFAVAVSSWGYWFKNNAPSIHSFLYLEDEPASMANTNKYSTWMSTMPTSQTSGYTVHSFVTGTWTTVHAGAPLVDNPAATQFLSSDTVVIQNMANTYCLNASTRCWAYNGHPDFTGTAMATEDNGISPWTITWGAWKKGVNGWFQWASTNWNDSNTSPAENPLWTKACTFGNSDANDAALGVTGFNHANGDGVLQYPGTEVSTYTASSYGILGPINTLRLKHIRRSINDYDYISQAYAVNASSTSAIVAALMPQALWDILCYDPADCSYHYGGRTWSEDPEAWENARTRLALIITGAPAPPGASSKTLSGGATLSGKGTFQ